MLAFELPISIFLDACVVLSGVVFVFTRPKAIKLKHQEYEPLAGEEPYVYGSGARHDDRDVFDVSRPEDTFDGFPINEGEFWANVRAKKLRLVLVLLILVAINSFTFGWLESTEGDSSTISLATTLQLLFNLYLLLLTLVSIAMSTVETHWPLMIHISALGAIATFTLGVSALLPISTSELAHLPLINARVVVAFRLASLALLFIATAIVSKIRRGPPLHCPVKDVYSAKELTSAGSYRADNVCAVVQSSVIDRLLFSFTTPVVLLGYTAESLYIKDLPVLRASMRATNVFAQMRHAMRAVTPGSTPSLMRRLFDVNASLFVLQAIGGAISAVASYAPAYFILKLVSHIEKDPYRDNLSWGWVYCAGLFFAYAFYFMLIGQVWFMSSPNLLVRLRLQLSTTLFAKTLVRQNVASSAPSPSGVSVRSGHFEGDPDDFSSKTQVMILMTTDVERASEFSWHAFSFVDVPVEIVIGTLFLYHLLGRSALVGLVLAIVTAPLSYLMSRFVLKAQENLAKARDERITLMHEVLGSIRMLKFLAWERDFGNRILRLRNRELNYQRLSYLVEAFYGVVWKLVPALVVVASFYHFTVIRGEALTPAIAFAAIAVFNQLQWALNSFPETVAQACQSFASLRRIETYLSGAEITSPSPSFPEPHGRLRIGLSSATITWPRKGMTSNHYSTNASYAAPSPMPGFVLQDINLEFPAGELSLICGKPGSGKTLLLHSLLGEAELLSGQIACPRTPPDALAHCTDRSYIADTEWTVSGVCAYVPQTAWLQQNLSIKENILFGLPYNQLRYKRTIEACGLVHDLRILEDDDETEVGERGANLSASQRAKISLARAVYSRASILLIDDVLSIVDANTAYHIYDECIKGPILAGRTVILASHHVKVCAAGARYIVALDNGHVRYAGEREEFFSSGLTAELMQKSIEPEDEKKHMQPTVEESIDYFSPTSTSPLNRTVRTLSQDVAPELRYHRRASHKLTEEEPRSVGRIPRRTWFTYIGANGGVIFWIIFLTIVLLSVIVPVIQNNWLRIWSGRVARNEPDHSERHHVKVYATIIAAGIFIQMIGWLVIYQGSVRASRVLHRKMLEAVLFAGVRFHDTVTRARLLNRFGKDLEDVDSGLSDNFGQTVLHGLSVIVAIVTIAWVVGPTFLVVVLILGIFYYNVAKVYGQASRDMRRLDSATRSALYTTYSETIGGIGVLRGFGASTKILRAMHQQLNSNVTPYFWLWSINRWISARFQLLSSIVVGLTGVIVLLNERVDASFAGLALTFAIVLTYAPLDLMRRFVGLEQSMVAFERVHEYTNLVREGPEFIRPGPPTTWPFHGTIEVNNLVVRYAPDLPDALRGVTFSIPGRSKIGVLGPTGSGKSTLALSFFRLVEIVEGSIIIDGVDISRIGLSDLRSRLSIIPQDPVFLAGTLRSTMDISGEYTDQEILNALEAVHLLFPSTQIPQSQADMAQQSYFRNLDSSVSEGGENFTVGQKQLICMARAVLRQSKVIFVDEAIATIDYATNDLIERTIRHAFAECTVITIAHRIRSIIDFDMVMVMDEGRIVEYDHPHVLLANSASKFYALCKSTGPEEFEVLKEMAEPVVGTSVSSIGGA
ncbi:hypothetical protein BOTBODRAFT_61330 [Botryobasidium botryosum FD-172 SS1]|uniref:Uncharacterized protein n=1 Tax=Botryobasidium botryosum (strain FD-172 SS1) TaxID=930990 RepID=A0A067N1F6_BOTB1|nr:hypothetical protein BOTBODRAFT_61330 [Botryobasidium botryosum FD-172 SS1]